MVMVVVIVPVRGWITGVSFGRSSCMTLSKVGGYVNGDRPNLAGAPYRARPKEREKVHQWGCARPAAPPSSPMTCVRLARLLRETYNDPWMRMGDPATHRLRGGPIRTMDPHCAHVGQQRRSPVLVSAIWYWCYSR
jgi:hypothetical protein